MSEDAYSMSRDTARRVIAATRRVEGMPPTVPPAHGWGGAGEPRQRRMQLITVLYNSTSGTAYFLDWDATTEEFVADTSSTITVYGDLMTGFAFIDQKVQSVYMGGKWYCLSAGSQNCRGVLLTTLASAGTASVQVTRYTGSAWAATATSVTAREFLGLTATLAIGTIAFLSWCDLSQQWLVTGAEC